MVLIKILFPVEFEPCQSSTDDEETIEAEEKGHLTDSIADNKEIEMLKKESELPIEDLLSRLPEDYLNNVSCPDQRQKNFLKVLIKKKKNYRGRPNLMMNMKLMMMIQVTTKPRY